jgi:penicillin-binding protein 2
MFNFFKKRKIYFQSEIEPHEILLDKLAKKKEEKWGLSERKFEVPLLKRILQGFFYFSILLFLFFFLKTFQFQVIEGKEFLSQAEENRYIFHKIQAQRGIIYDGEGRQLVFNRLSFDLVCEKNNLPQSEIERKKIFKEVSQILKMNSDELGKKIQESEELEALISQNLDHQTLIILETKIKDLQGFKIVENSIREYKDGEYFSHLIGFMGKIKSEEWKNNLEFYLINDYVGRTGIENFYEDILRKNPGKLRLERDARGNIISKEVISLPESGKSLVLWLDSDLQKKIEDELEKKVKEVGAKGAAAVALDPRTGGVMALVSYPNFDNNLFSKGISPEEWKKIEEDPLKPLFNRAIAGTYLTGSTIKPLIASAALEEKIISPDKKINDSEGKIIVQDYWNPEKIWEYNDWTVHGWTDMRKAIAESCNVYFYTVGGGYGDQEGLGPTKIKEYLEKFGWNQRTGIDLPGEVEGFIPDPSWKKSYFERKEDQVWVDGDTYYLSIGQGYLKITPLEVATSFVPIANGGKMFQPKVVQKIVDSEKNLIEEIQPQILKENFIDPKNLQVVREGMRQTVTAGSATGYLDSLPVSVAAKTGTAELGGDYYHNWITVFAPYDDPQIVLTIVIEKVKDVRVAVLPVAREILNWYFTREVNY